MKKQIRSTWYDLKTVGFEGQVFELSCYRYTLVMYDTGGGFLINGTLYSFPATGQPLTVRVGGHPDHLVTDRLEFTGTATAVGYLIIEDILER